LGDEGQTVEMARAWPIVLQFGLGAVLCAIGLWCGWRSGYLDLRLREDRWLIAMIVGGFAGLLALLCAFTFWLPYVSSTRSP
jgi:hypothetical protein